MKQLRLQGTVKPLSLKQYVASMLADMPVRQSARARRRVKRNIKAAERVRRQRAEPQKT